jgi:anti-sigma factor (TIGR02949 family)
MTIAFDCRRALDELQDWLRREATPESAAAIAEHLEACAPCRHHAEFEERFRAVLGRAGAQERCPPEIRARLVAALRREAGG